MKKTLSIILFLSSLTFLIYEVSWNRYLSLMLGTTIKASTIVIVSFMLGLGLGSFYYGKLISNEINGKNYYKILYKLLLLIGIFNLITYALISLIPQMYQLVNSEFLALTYSGIAILLPAFFMGGILPVIGHIYVSELESRKSSIYGFLYSTETIGSAIGGLLTGFYLLGNIGQKFTILLAVTINILSAIVIFVLNMNKKEKTTNEQSTEKKTKKVEKNLTLLTSNKNSNKLAIISTFVTGLSGLGLQLVWMRIFKIHLTNTSYTFALISVIMIFGLFLGSTFFKNREKKKQSKNYYNLLAFVQAMITIYILIGATILYYSPNLILLPLHHSLTSSALRILLPPIVVSVSVILPISVLFGYSFPLICKIYSESEKSTGNVFGHIMLSNTAGSVVGPLIATFIFIPVIGVMNSIFLFLVINLTLIIYQLRFTSFYSNKTSNIFFYLKTSMIALIIIISGYISFIGDDKIKILPPSFSESKKNILFYNETIEGTITVGEDIRTKAKSTYINNSSVIGTDYNAIKAVKLLGHLPFLVGLQAKNCLIVGFGIGVTTSTLATHKDIETIDCVELVSDLQYASKYYSIFNNNVINDERLNIVEGDGRHHLLTTEKRYDLISSDPTHPVLGSSNLYSKEYFQLCHDKLTENGIVSQYLPLHKLLPNDFLGIIKTFSSVFPEATVWLGHTHAILLGTKNKLDIDFIQFAKEAKKINDKFFYNNPYHLATTLYLDSKRIKEFITDNDKIKIDTDNQSQLEFFDYSSFDVENWEKNILLLKDNRSELSSVFSNINDRNRLRSFMNGSNILVDALVQSVNGKKERYYNLLQQAYSKNNENEELLMMIKAENKKRKQIK